MGEALRAGLVAGLVTIFLAAVGLIGNFTDLNLIGEVDHVRPVDDLAPADRRRLRDDAIACRRRRDRRALDDAGGHATAR